MIKLLSLFSGIGAFEKALDNLDVPYDLVGYCEIDKYASKSYSVIHDVSESMNIGDITKVDENALPKDIDLITYGFPCQDISLAGKQQGLFNDDGTQTRSGLFFEAMRIIEATKPKVAIAENVKNLLSKKFNAQFQVVLASLEHAGYNNYFKVLNAKDYGIPQNRERVFIVSIRKDLDTRIFEFPEAFPLEKRLKDLLEESVDEKYYLSEDQMKSIINWKAQQKPFERVLGNASISPTLTARGAGEYHSGMIIYSPDNDDTCNLQNEVTERFAIDKSKNNPSPIEVANCLTSREDRGVSSRRSEGTAICEVLVKEATKQGYAEAYVGDSVNLEQPNSTTRRGRVGRQVAQTLTTTPQQGVVVSEPKIEVVGNYSPSGHDASRVVSAEGLAPIVKENHGTVTAIVEPEVIGGIGEKRSNDGRQWYQQDRIYDSEKVAISVATGFNPFYAVEEPLAYDEQNGYIRKDGTVGTIMTDGSSPKKNNRIIEGELRIRKLTPKECFRLMGFDDESFHKAEAVNSNTQLYKQAGNSIVVDVLEELLCMMLDEDGQIYV